MDLSLRKTSGDHINPGCIIFQKCLAKVESHGGTSGGHINQGCIINSTRASGRGRHFTSVLQKLKFMGVAEVISIKGFLQKLMVMGVVEVILI